MTFASSKIRAQSAIVVPFNPCKEEEDVIWFCGDCGQKLCDRCKKTHLRSTNSKNHNVLPIFDDLSVIKKHVSSACNTHSEPFSFYCRTCASNICSRCLSEAHTKHDFVDICEFFVTIQKEFSELLGTKDKEKQQMAEHRASLLRYESSFKTYIQDCESNIDDRVKEIQRSAVTEGSVLMSKLAAVKEKELESVNSQRNFNAKHLYNPTS